jgi:hypothetical protein
VEQAILERTPKVFVVTKLDYRDVTNKYPCMVGRFVAYGGLYISNAKVQGPRFLVSSKNCEMRLIGAQKNRYNCSAFR